MKLKNSILLIITALIWGTAFVAQSSGADKLGPYTFNCIRSIMGGLALLFVIMIFDKIGITDKSKRKYDKNLLLGGLFCGILLFLASTMQQLGIYKGAETGKAGFLTACYILLVPIFSIFIGKKGGINIWIGVVITVAGLYLLCMKGSFSVKKSDIYLLICAVIFALHIMVIDHFSPLVDGVVMSFIQFIICGLLGTIPMVIFEMENINKWAISFKDSGAIIALLYAGIMSSGVAYTLQIVGQKDMNPTIASMLLSLESVFSVLAGFVLLGEKLSKRELMGCLFIFIAIIVAQLPVGKENKKA